MLLHIRSFIFCQPASAGELHGIDFPVASYSLTVLERVLFTALVTPEPSISSIPTRRYVATSFCSSPWSNLISITMSATKLILHSAHLRKVCFKTFRIEAFTPFLKFWKCMAGSFGSWVTLTLFRSSRCRLMLIFSQMIFGNKFGSALIHHTGPYFLAVFAIEALSIVIKLCHISAFMVWSSLAWWFVQVFDFICSHIHFMAGSFSLDFLVIWFWGRWAIFRLRCSLFNECIVMSIYVLEIFHVFYRILYFFITVAYRHVFYLYFLFSFMRFFIVVFEFSHIYSKTQTLTFPTSSISTFFRLVICSFSIVHGVFNFLTLHGLLYLP